MAVIGFSKRLSRNTSAADHRPAVGVDRDRSVAFCGSPHESKGVTLNLDVTPLLTRGPLQKNLVPRTGIEPARLSTLDPKSSASTNFATSA